MAIGFMSFGGMLTGGEEDDIKDSKEIITQLIESDDSNTNKNKKIK